MKKLYLLGGLMLTAFAGFSQNHDVIQLLGRYAQKVSPNGKYMSSMSDEAAIYNVETGEMQIYPDCYLGLGRSVADNGMGVGDNSSQGYFFNGSSYIVPEALRPYSFSTINAITPDGSRIVGYVGLPDTHMLVCPYYCDVDEDGNVGELNVLPYPKEDFLGSIPAYVTAMDVSVDGKTIIGNMVDWTGRLTDPVAFVEDENGEWTCILPSRPYFNPQHIEVPANPWADEPPYPEYVDYMDAENAALYERAYEEFIMGGEWPNPFEYMDPDQADEYQAAVDKYMEWYYEYQPLFKPFDDAFLELLKSTVSYGLNDMVLSPDGSYFYTIGSVDNDDDLGPSNLYKFNLAEESRETVHGVPGGTIPSQILPDGTFIVAAPIRNMGGTYLRLPDSETFISVNDYLMSDMRPDWLENPVELPIGKVSISDDFSTFAVGVMDPGAEYMFTAYILSDFAESGVEAVEADGVSIKAMADGSLLLGSDFSSIEIYDLAGRKVNAAKNLSGSYNPGLSNGIYVVKAVAADGKVANLKVKL